MVARESREWTRTKKKQLKFSRRHKTCICLLQAHRGIHEAKKTDAHIGSSFLFENSEAKSENTADPGFWSGAAEFWPQKAGGGGALSPKFAQNRGFPLKLPENCMIKQNLGARGPPGSASGEQQSRWRCHVAPFMSSASCVERLRHSNREKTQEVTR